jgi:putative endonuclease
MAPVLFTGKHFCEKYFVNPLWRGISLQEKSGMSYSSIKAGHEGEDLACKLLQEKGFEIIERNYRYGKKGEIDIVAREGDALVFVEVKYKKNLEYGEPEFSITKTKMNQLRKMAGAYLFDKNILEVYCRFDVVTVLEINSGIPLINHYANAF